MNDPEHARTGTDAVAIEEPRAESRRIIELGYN